MAMAEELPALLEDWKWVRSALLMKAKKLIRKLEAIVANYRCGHASKILASVLCEIRCLDDEL